MVITRDAAPGKRSVAHPAPFAAELLVVDSGSGDDTSESRARSCGARSCSNWLGFESAEAVLRWMTSQDWVLCLDADERVSPRLAGAIARIVRGRNPAAAAYAIARRNRFLGRWLAHGERLSRLDGAFCSIAGTRGGPTIRARAQ